MESIRVFERTKGRRRSNEAAKEAGGLAAGFFGDTMDDELSELMPSLKRQLEAIDDDDEATLNFLGEISIANGESIRHNDKENVVFDRNSIREARRRRGRASVTTSKHIDFNKLLARNKTLKLGPSNSPYESNTTVLKDNVLRAGNESKIVDDFWSTGKKKRVSAVARRRLSGMKTPGSVKAKAVEDRNVRRARSRFTGGNRRTLSRRPIKLDFHMDAAKISEWDQEILAEEEVAPSTRAHYGASMSSGRCVVDAQVPPSTRACSVASMPAQRTTADSPGSLPDMEMSSGEFPHIGLPGLADRVEPSETPVQDQGRAHAGFPVQGSNLQIPEFPLTSPTPPSNPVTSYMSLRRMQRDVGQRRLSFFSSPSSESVDTSGSQEGGIRIQIQDKIATPSLANDYREAPHVWEDDDYPKVPAVRETEPRDNCNSSSLGKQTVPSALQQIQEDLQVPQAKEIEPDHIHNDSSLERQAEPMSYQQNQEDDEETKVPKVKETEPHDVFNSSDLGKQTASSPLQQTQEESFDEVPIENKRQLSLDSFREDRETVAQNIHPHQSNPPIEGLIGTDEGSTTHSKPERAKRRAKKAENRRFSLEEFGTTWKEGQRRSQRKKLRPLEWWRGEKVLHGRIHHTLTTVIGVKFSSPGKYARGIAEPFVVESYVPAQYSELVKFAAI